jgi:hypothetical protein
MADPRWLVPRRVDVEDSLHSEDVVEWLTFRRSRPRATMASGAAPGCESVGAWLAEGGSWHFMAECDASCAVESWDFDDVEGLDERGTGRQLPECLGGARPLPAGRAAVRQTMTSLSGTDRNTWPWRRGSDRAITLRSPFARVDRVGPVRASCVAGLL